MDNIQNSPGCETNPLRPAPVNEELILFFERFALPVYRFHLLMSGDPATAEARTAQSYLTTRKRLADRRKPWTSPETWFWRIVLEMARGRVTGKAREIVRAQPAAGPEVDFSEAEPDSLRMQRALIPPLSQALDRMPAREAQLVGLLLFAGLSTRQVSEISGIPPESIELRMDRAVLRLAEHLGSGFEDGGSTARSLPDDLRELSDRVHPDQRFLQSLRSELDRVEPVSQRAAGQLRSSGRSLRKMAWVPLVAAGLVIFASSIWSLPARLTATPLPPPAPTAASTPAPNPVPVTGSGYLTPVSAQVCSQARQTVEASLKIHTQVDQDARFLDPLLNNQDHNGSGCQIQGTAGGDVLRDPDYVIQVLLPVLSGLGYEMDNQFGSSSTCPDCYQFPRDWFGKGVRLTKKDGRALLTVGWRPADPSLCAVGSIPLTCPLPPKDNILSVRLILADDPVRQTLSTFFSRWQNGDRAALKLVTSDLQKRLTSLADLDNLTGLQQNQIARSQIDWDAWPPGLETFQMLAVILPIRAHPDQSHGPFIQLHIVLMQENDAWRIQDIWRIGIEQTGDSAFIAGPDGRILLLSSQTGSTVALTDPGFFRPSRQPGAGAPDTRYRLSPDGQWLAVSLPVDNQGTSDPSLTSSGTWLVSTGGSGAIQVSPAPLQLAWAPNSQGFAYISPRDPQAILMYDLQFGASSVLTRLPGRVRGMAWSPDGLSMGVSYPVSAAGQTKVELGLVTVANSHVEPLVDLPADAPGFTDPDQELHWTSSGSELWFFPSMVAVDVKSGAVSPLAPLSHASLEFLRQPNFGAPGKVITRVSPDGWYVANTFNEGFLGSSDWVAVHFILGGVDLTSAHPEAKRVGSISALAWTDGSQNLIIAGGVTSLQPIYRMDPSTGELHQLASSAAFIGMRSTLFAQSTHAIPDVTASPQPQPDSQTPWLEKYLPAYHLHLQVPYYWQFYGLDQNLGWAMISSSSLSSSFGVARIPAGQQIIQISAQPMVGAQPPKDQPPVTWRPTKVGGQAAYQLAAPAYPGGPLLIQVPTADELVSISVFPFPSSADPILQRILDSISFK